MRITYRRILAGVLSAAMSLAIPVAIVRADTPVSAAPEVPKVAPMPLPPPPPDGPPEAPAPKVTKEEALARLKQFFTLPAETDRLSIIANLLPYGKTPVWDFMVNIREEYGGSGFSLATVDALTGNILHYGSPHLLPRPIPTGPVPAPRPEAEALEKAWSLVREVAPDRAANLRLADRNTPGGYVDPWSAGRGLSLPEAYQFVWIEYRDGIPFPGSRVDLAVDKGTLEFLTLHVSVPNSLNFRPGPAKVTAHEAMRLWRARTRPELRYVPVYSGSGARPGEPAAYRLVYSFESAMQTLDAMTGQWLSPGGGSLPADGNGKPQVVLAGDGKPVLPESLPLSDAAARKLADALLELPDGAVLNSYSDPYYAGDIANFNWSQGDTYANVAVDLRTGMIRNASRQVMTAAPEGHAGPVPAATPAQEMQARQAAVAVLQTYFSQFRDQVMLEPQVQTGFLNPGETGSRQFFFRRYVGGIPVSYDTIGITIDLKTMKWRDMYTSWSGGSSFPPAEGLMTPEKATDAFFASRKPALIYHPVFAQPDQRPAMPYDRWVEPTEASLVYVLTPEQPSVLTDARTGDPVGWDGLPVTALKEATDKLKGHWAEAELRHMVAMGVIQPQQVEPGAPVTRTQALQMLLSRKPDLLGKRDWVTFPSLPYSDLPPLHPAFSAARTAWAQGWLQPDPSSFFRPDDAVTRAQFAVWMARSLGLGDLARSPLAVKADYTDLAGLSAEERNAVAFLRALSLLDGASAFRGSDPLTQAEGAQLTVRLFNYLLAR